MLSCCLLLSLVCTIVLVGYCFPMHHFVQMARPALKLDISLFDELQPLHPFCTTIGLVADKMVPAAQRVEPHAVAMPPSPLYPIVPLPATVLIICA